MLSQPIRHTGITRGAFWMILLGVTSVQAVTTSLWEERTAADFLSGKPQDVCIHSVGRIALAPKIRQVQGIQAIYVWALAHDRSGNLYIGTGEPGVVYKLSPEGTVREFYRSSELHIHSLAVDTNNNVYAGTSPNGLIFRIAPDGNASTFYDAEESYIWALAFDNFGRLIVATGNPGRILALTPEGKAVSKYDPHQAHILSLTVGQEGEIFAGSAPNGIVYRLTPKGDVSVLYDAHEPEIRCLVLDAKGNLYAGTASAAQPRTPISQPAAPQTAPGGQAPSASPQVGDFSGPTRPSPPAPAGNSIYRISLSTQVVHRFFSLPKGSILSLAMDSLGRLWAGTGDEGQLYRVTDEHFELFVGRGEKQVLAMLRGSNGLWVATANPGRVLFVSPEYSREGTYLSSVHDTGIFSRWGRICWEADVPEKTKVTLSTRAGNSATPDNTWSSWSNEYENPAGVQVESPAARFIQYRVKFLTEDPHLTPLLKSVSLAYLTQNLPPEITELRVGDHEARGDRGGKRPTQPITTTQPSPQPSLTPPSPPPQRRSAQVRIAWNARDPNNDRLIFDLYYKGIEEKEWKPLKTGLKENSYTWETESVPDGRYHVKLVASDSPDNPGDTAQKHTKFSEPFEVDNTRPSVLELKESPGPEKKILISGLARDNLSYIQKIEYAINGGEWRPIFPADNVFDSAEERFSFYLEGLTPGEHTIVVRATDSQQNVGTGKIVIHIQ